MYTRTRAQSRDEVERVILDDGIGQQIAAHFIDLLERTCTIAFRQLDLDQLALTDFADAGKPQRAQCGLDRLALRVENTGFQSDVNARFHVVQGSADAAWALGPQPTGVACRLPQFGFWPLVDTRTGPTPF